MASNLADESTQHTEVREAAHHESASSLESSSSPESTEEDSSLRSPPQRRSISFRKPSPSPGPMERRQSRRVQSQRTSSQDGIADETTAIIGAESGGPKDYQTTRGSAVAAQDCAASTVSKHGGRVSRASGGRRQDQSQAPGYSESWWKRIAEKYGSVELENKGSVARDHLALERTFLAWLRTSLSFASIGIAITQLFRLNTAISQSDSTAGQNRLRQVGKPLGATFIAVSTVILLIGFHRYFESQSYIIRGKFPASRGGVLLIAFVAGALIVASLVVILAIAPHAFEKR